MSDYTCGKCGASGCKLWREYGSFYRKGSLRCAPCAAEAGGKDISDIDENGARTSDLLREHPTLPESHRRTLEIGWYVPAVPTDSPDAPFWGYTSTPDDAATRWQSLPTLPQR